VVNVVGVVSRVSRKPRNMFLGGDKNLVCHYRHGDSSD